jgi:LmbE family N-acetylglucosaminyl deacetylase
MNFLSDPAGSKAVLVLVAHLDDEVLGMGGTIHRLTQAGFEVYVLVLSAKTTLIVPDASKDADLKACSLRVKDVLGIKEYLYLNFMDGRLDQNMPELVGGIDQIFDRIQPAYVFSHCSHDANQDHRAVYRAAEILSRRFRERSWLRGIFSFEVISASNFSVRTQFEPAVFVEIDVGKKAEALQCYLEEMRAGEGDRNEAGVRFLAGYRGMQCGYQFAEGFELLKWRFQ